MNNSKSKLYMLVVMAVVVVAAVVVSFLVGSKKHDITTNSNSSSSKDKISTDTSKPSTSTETTKPSATNTVAINNFAFSPATITIKVGTTVTWTNNDSIGHTVTADSKSADAPDSQLFGKGETVTFTFNKVGSYAYHCAPHPYMTGTVIVTE